jgi:hypothetical protein
MSTQRPRRPRFVPFAALLPFAAALGAQQLIRTDPAFSLGEAVGAAVCAVGDQDGDGVSDYLLGTPGFSLSFAPGCGAVRLHSGRNGALLRTVQRQDPGGRFGTVLAALGDIDGDQVGDYAVGGPDENGGRGVVVAISGQSGFSLFTCTGGPGWRLGSAFARLGDFDGDGNDELLVGAAGGGGGQASRLLVYALPGGALLHTELHTGTSRVGLALATVGDTDGDGRTEVAVQEELAGGGSVVHLYRTNGTGQFQLGQTWTHRSAGADLGRALAAAGDVDGDGVPDVAASISTPFEAVYVLRADSGRAWREIAPVPANIGFGASVASLGDLDGDGRPELGIGAPGTNAMAGAVFIHGGAAGQLLAVVAGQPGDLAGACVASLGDIDGDTWPDFAVGRPFADVALPDAGAVDLCCWLLLGAYTPFGTACPGSAGVPMILGGQLEPRLGGTVTIRAQSLPPQRPCFAILGLSNASSGGVPLPLSLTRFGWPGCSLYVRPDAVELVPTSALGLVSRSVSVPSLLALTGLRLFGQFAVLEATGDLVFTAGLEARIGR